MKYVIASVLAIAIPAPVLAQGTTELAVGAQGQQAYDTYRAGNQVTLESGTKRVGLTFGANFKSDIIPGVGSVEQTALLASASSFSSAAIRST